MVVVDRLDVNDGTFADLGKLLFVEQGINARHNPVVAGSPFVREMEPERATTTRRRLVAAK